MKNVRATLAMLALVASIVPGAARAEVPDATVTFVPEGVGIKGHALWDSWFDLSPHGYTEAEYFVSGTARSATQSAPYTTRIIVTRPKSAEAFNGTVVLEWTNVTAQFENAVDIISAHEMLLREGYAYVHASVQSAGICCTPLTPKVWDPVRYEDLSHPGDAYAADIFSQIAKALRNSIPTHPMAGLSVEQVIAVGQSQSASRLDSYVRQTQPTASVIDGFLIHGGGSKAYEIGPAAPVLHLLSDAEASTAAPSTSPMYRLWEIAGSSHSDFYIGYHQVYGQGPRFAGGPKASASADEEMHAVAGNYGEIPHPHHGTCTLAGAAFPMRYAVNAAIHHLNVWVREGIAPPEGARFAFSNGTLARDQWGNALGGIRYPVVDHPVASYVSTVCRLGGKTVPFPDPLLWSLYQTHTQYYALMEASAAKAVEAGHLLPADAADLLARACSAQVRWQQFTTVSCD